MSAARGPTVIVLVWLRREERAGTHKESQVEEGDAATVGPLVPCSSLFSCAFCFFPPSSSSLLTRSFFGARLALHDLASCTALLDCNNSLEYCAHLRGVYVSRNERCVLCNRKRREENKSFTAFKRRKAQTSS